MGTENYKEAKNLFSVCNFDVKEATNAQEEEAIGSCRHHGELLLAATPIVV